MLEIGDGSSVVKRAIKKTVVTEEIDGGFIGKFVDIIGNIPFMFFYNESGGFILSDLPVYIGKDENIKEDNRIGMFFPLSSYFAVLFGKYENMMNNRMVILDDANTAVIVDGYIKQTCSKAERIYCRSELQRREVITRIKEKGYAGIH